MTRVYVLPPIPDDVTKNARAARNACATEGRCPCCGAIGRIEPVAGTAGVLRWTFAHDDDCPAIADQRTRRSTA